MISKVVPANSFYHTCRYIANKPGADVLDVEGVRGHSYKLMAEDFITQQEMRPNKERACFHGILSFYPGENPSDDTMRTIALKYLEELGIVNTQYAISKHTDKAHLHLHIVANMVNNDGKSIRDSYIGLRGKKIAQRLTQQYNLVPALEKNLKLTHLENLSDIEANKYKIYVAISEILSSHCRSMEELETRLLKQGIETQFKYKGHTNEKQGISFKIGDYCFKGSQVDRKFSFSGLEKAFSQKQEQVIKQQQQVEISDQSENSKPLLKRIIQQKRKDNIDKGQALEKPIKKGIESDLSKAVEKTLDDLLRPVETSEDLPYELTQEEHLRNLKKKSHRHKR